MNLYIHTKTYTQCALRAHARRNAASARQQRETSSDVFHGDESNNQSNRENDPRNVALLIRNCK